MAKFLGFILVIFGALILYGSWIVKGENANSSTLFIGGFVFGAIVALIGIAFLFGRRKPRFAS